MKHWVHHFESESKIQSKQWKHYGFSFPKKLKQAESVGKVIASYFLESKSVVMIHYLKKDKTINGYYYVSEFRH